MEESYPMIGGKSRYSYATNSHPQKVTADDAKALLFEAIAENLDIEHACPVSRSTYRIADLGCSVGPNTYTAMETIIEAVVQKYRSKGHLELPDFQVFFNDHVSNDFNTLFVNLPREKQHLAAGVPGSFYTRLFPKASLNFVYSAYALQWLSMAPPEIGDLNSPSCNKGRISHLNAPDEVGQAYSAQYAKDMESFLGARAQELAPGGLMAILIPSSKEGNLPAQTSPGPYIQPLESSLLDMANEGLICKDKINSFNLPIYSPSLEELRTVISNNGCFDIVRLEAQSREYGFLSTTEECRAGLGSILGSYFGSENMDVLFERYSKKIAGRSRNVPDDNSSTVGLFILLRRINH